jgi:hypothetical protein
MNETQNLDNQGLKSNNSNKKNQHFLIKMVAILSLIAFSYVGFKYWQIEKSQRLAAQEHVKKFDNVESEIFDLSDEYKAENPEENFNDLEDLTINELREKGAEFIYQMLIKNQVQINDLKEQINSLKSQITKYKNQEKIGKMILVYVDLREKFLAGANYSDSLKSFEILASSDENLQKKITKLKLLLPNFTSKKDLENSFEKLIPDLITIKTNKPDGGIIAKIRHNISKLVIIRKIDGKNPESVDGIIAIAEKHLREESYQEVMNSLLSLKPDYHKILSDFLTKLNVAIELQKVDEEILNYLKSLT